MEPWAVHQLDPHLSRLSGGGLSEGRERHEDACPAAQLLAHQRTGEPTDLIDADGFRLPALALH